MTSAFLGVRTGEHFRIGVMGMSGNSSGKMIIVDWGTTSLRANLVAATGNILDRRETRQGMQFINLGEYEDVLTKTIGDWLQAYAPLDIIAFGMVTSRTGWVEVPYVACPAAIEDLARGAILRQLNDGSPLYLLPGITDTSRDPFPDVMRGEETQIVGYGVGADATIVLPGTHSKWARVANLRIESFQTFVTGEIFALLSEHSFIANAATGTVTDVDWGAFEQGVGNAISGEPGKNPLLTLLFSARTGMLHNQLQPDEIGDYVSGLLIGSEFRMARECGWFKSGDSIGIVGNDGLNARYRRAAMAFDLSVNDGGEDAATIGALTIARQIKETI